VTPGGQFTLHGEKIKIEPATGDDRLGVFITDETNTYPVAPLAVVPPEQP
jgi:hypothetical protein